MNSIGDEIVRHIEMRHLRGGRGHSGERQLLSPPSSKDLDVMVTSEVYLQERTCSLNILGYLLMWVSDSHRVQPDMSPAFRKRGNAGESWLWAKTWLLMTRLDRFICSRVRACGLEMLGTKRQRHRIESGGQPSEY